MQSKNVRIGIIGMGIMGRMYARLINENPESELIALCEIDPERKSDLMKNYQVPVYEDFAEMMDQENLDAIFITTPDHLHFRPAILAAKKNLHMMIEKPLALNLDDAIQMRNVTDESGSVAMMAHVFRWYAPFVMTKSALSTQEFGQPLAMNMRIDDRIYVPTKMLRWADQTTPGWFLLSHAVDLANWFSESTPVNVYAYGVNKKLTSMGINTFDLIHFDITYQNGFVASLEACWILPNSLPSMSGSWCTIISSEGGHYINVQDQMIQRAGATFENPATIRMEMHGRLVGLQSFMLQSFLDSILRGKEVVSNISDGVIAVSVLESAHLSLSSGKKEEINI